MELFFCTFQEQQKEAKSQTIEPHKQFNFYSMSMEK